MKMFKILLSKCSSQTTTTGLRLQSEGFSLQALGNSSLLDLFDWRDTFMICVVSHLVNP